MGPDGDVWLGGYRKGDISRFDGRRWTAYTEEDGLVHDHIMDIAIGPEGAVWFATAEGIARFDGERWTVYTEGNGLLSNVVLAIAVAPDGTVWAGMDGGLAGFDGQHWTVHKVGRDIP